MALDKRTRENFISHCGEIREGDGIDPRQFFKSSRGRKKEDRKAKQLCRQVAETLDQILAGELGDDVLRMLRVSDVLPAPNASRLLVTLIADCPPQDFNRGLIDDRLAQFCGRLRSEVAAAITRRKAPSLAFEVIGPCVAEHARRKEVDG